VTLNLSSFKSFSFLSLCRMMCMWRMWRNWRLNSSFNVFLLFFLFAEPTSHVMLNHLYAQSVKDNVLVMACTTRFRRKYATVVLYKPIDWLQCVHIWRMLLMWHVLRVWRFKIQEKYATVVLYKPIDWLNCVHIWRTRHVWCVLKIQKKYAMVVL
jgi:hypothetical protein